MKVKILTKIYQMSYDEYRGLLDIASEKVPFGIYAAEKKGYGELLNIKAKSSTELKNEVRLLRSKGFKVYYNRG